MAAASAGIASADFANPSFEDPITFNGPPFVGSWEGFSGNFGGGAASATQGPVMPRTGANAVELAINTASGFAGVFQDIDGLVAGQEVTFSGWNKLGSGLIGPEVRIEWRDASPGTTEVTRTPNLVPVLTGEYTEFSLTTTVPAGATAARAVYAGQTFGAGLSGGSIFIDDFSFSVVPEPTTALLAGVALAAAAARRR